MAAENPESRTLVDKLGGGVVWTLVLAAGCAVVGAVAGLVLAMHSHVTDCPDGTIIEDGQDPNCYAYPDAALGVSIIFACLALVLLILLAGRILLLVTPASTKPTVEPTEPLNTYRAIITSEPVTDPVEAPRAPPA